MSFLSYLTGVPQNYAWGRKGKNSSVAKLMLSDTPKAIEYSDDKPYAELWYGTHPSGPSRVHDAKTDKTVITSTDGNLLRDVLQEDLPFLLKVLSIGGALSLQAHPDLTLAQKLHQQDPKNYKDGNHKPELVVALESMHVLCGFRTVRDILRFATNVTEFGTLLGKDVMEMLQSSLGNPDEEKKALKFAFGKTMYTDSTLATTYLDQYVAAYAHKAGAYQKNLQDTSFATKYASSTDKFTNCVDEDVYALVYDLTQQYPNDIGAFGPFFLNYFTLLPYQSVFLGPNEPHAYLHGDCVEIMACSDNVVRVGLTPKFRDLDTLIDMLTYSMAVPQVTNGTVLSTTEDVCEEYLYAPSMEFPEFMVTRSVLPKQASLALTSLPVPSIGLCIAGEGYMIVGEDETSKMPIQYGASVLIPKDTKVTVVNTSTTNPLVVFRGSANVSNLLTSAST